MRSHGPHRLAFPLAAALLLPCLSACGSGKPLPAGQEAVADVSGNMWLPVWHKVTGQPSGYSGVPDGISGDRENAYAWSMEIFDGYLWVGTNRDVLGYMFMQPGMPHAPPEVPSITDVRARIYRMRLGTGEWEEFYTPVDVTGGQGPIRMGGDGGYRMAKAHTNARGETVLYLGGLGSGSPGRPAAASLVAIDLAASRGGSAGIVRPFSEIAEKVISIRAIATHDGNLFWATDDMQDPKTSLGPALFYSADPLADYRAGVPFKKLSLPSAWVLPHGGEVVDMVSFNGALYVFLLPHDSTQGFWCGKLKKVGGGYEWELVVGDPALGARYPSGMGRAVNGGAVPIVFRDKVYVGTLDGAAFLLMNGQALPAPGDVTMGGLHGMQIFRFDRDDRWERVMPPRWVKNASLLELWNGFANPANKYIWRFGVQGGVLYAGTFDIGTGVELLSSSLSVTPPKLRNPLGFDLYRTVDGETWFPVSLDGFHDQYNYGARSFVTDPASGDLYLGTANPFFGCQVWKKPAWP